MKLFLYTIAFLCITKGVKKSKRSRFLSKCIKNKNREHLYIHHKVISKISVQIGMECNLSSFLTIELYRTGMGCLPRDAFHGISKVRKLILSYNNFTCIPDLTNIASSLTHLYINVNKLGECKNDVKYHIKFNKLRSISLHKNGLTQLPSIIFQSVSLEILILHDNKFKLIPNLLDTSPALYKLYLRKNNDLQCCQMLWIYDVKELTTDTEQCKPDYVKQFCLSVSTQSYGKSHNSTKHCL